ncbi:DNA polymerase III subunit beta (plasmid) [Anabaena sp. PCC 7938]|uniref:DNA polymerase III, beta subunit n=1 Tax=Anabaena cylindrica (strain ATCC 27899 / PCC 7122) TaxID=272123 RepID=K9ZQX3_ANACC|nr:MULTISPECIES: DNA polymerase III subunit beta [Anabaena]AFZ60957.1 DNA polymerase III, beta subunit [Anabaena cylindrica PCC 7122]MCM2409354.1 DNA polymerase III subunit beta [Anabaena sp. CCAP 1446/1C]BAY06400.1 DNA polymerase III beta subunit [Anabaena cylindrica PCC 7122]
MTQTAPKQKVNSTKQTKQTSVATPEIDNEVSTNITEIPGVKKKKSTSANSETPTEPIQKKGNKRKKSKSKLNPPIPKELGMEVICEQTKFYNALFLVNCATPAKPSHPILANVLIIADVETQQIHLTVTDIALTIQASFAAQVLLKGEITVPVAMLLEIVKHCPSDNISLNSQTQMTQMTDENKPTKIYSLCLSDADGKYEIRGISAEEFPPTNIIDATPISLPTTVFKDGLKGVLYAVSTDENKYIVTGVHIQFAQEKLKFIGTDGHRVAITEVSTQGIGRKPRQQVTSEEMIKFTLPGRVVREIARNLGDDVKSISMLYNSQSNRLEFAWQDVVLSCQILEGIYPDCEQLLTKFSFEKEVILEKAPLVKALERLSVLTDKKEKGIYLQFDGSLQQLRLSIEREFGKGDQVIVANLPSEMMLNIQFNLKYLIEAAKAIPGTSIKMHLQQSDHPAMLVPDGDRPNPEVEMSMRHFLLPLYTPQQ